MLETVETYNDAAADIISFGTFVISPDAMCPINNIAR